MLPAVGQGMLALEARADDALASESSPRSTIRRRAPACSRSAPSSRGSRATATCRSPRSPSSIPRAACACAGSSRAQMASASCAARSRRAPRRRRVRAASWRSSCARAAARRFSRSCAEAAPVSPRPRRAGRRGPGSAGSHHAARRSVRCAKPTPSSTTRLPPSAARRSRRRAPSASTSGERGHSEPARTQDGDQRAAREARARGQTRGATQGRRSVSCSAAAARRRSACRAAGMPFEVVPGVSSAVGRARLRRHPRHRSALRGLLRGRDRAQGSDARARAACAGTSSRAPPTRS